MAWKRSSVRSRSGPPNPLSIQSSLCKAPDGSRGESFIDPARFSGPGGRDHVKQIKLAAAAQGAWESDEYKDLKERLKPVVQRTLRRDVLQYVSYTKRHALVQEFVPGLEEQRLYDLVSDYLQQPTLYALPSSQRQLMTLMLRKLLASSTYAIADTLAGLAAKLELAEAESGEQITAEEFAENFESLPEWEEWIEGEEEDGNPTKKLVVLTPE